MSLLVRQIGAGATMQDAGRPGWRKFGVPPGGAFDRESLMLANALLGQQAGSPALELVVMGATFDVLEQCRVALVGARAPVKCASVSLPSNGVVQLYPGDSLSIGVMTGAARLYVACSAQLESHSILGSCSGQEVRVGNIIGDVEAYQRWQDHLAKGNVEEPRPPSQVHALADPPYSLFRGAIRILPGPQAALFDLGKLTSEMFVATPQCDRVGLRLDGPTIGQPPELTSEPACLGAIQVTPSGMLLILGPEGPTIGGYPKVAVVIDADLDRLAQIIPGQKVWFEMVATEQAAQLAAERQARIDSVLSQLATLR